MTASYARAFYPFTISEKDYRLFSAAQNMVALRHGAKDTIFDFSAVYDGIFFEKVPIFEPGNSGFKNGNFSFILGSRKELCFVLNRSFHVQLSMRSVTVVKFDILF